ncbi:MAG: hypothetical protein HDS69_01800 [Bacteroidales bacterium]|nr:hypothetical protein [Bacteroidales bacterium]MBD5247016.1 hypothetical protein [Barnesiella sp.]MBD5257692.1 hypothetical protein [Barnesiella sp.]
MKQLITLLMLWAIGASTALAQDRLNIGELFDGRYHDDPRASETLIEGEKLSNYQLTLYRSLTLTDMPAEAAEIVPLVTRDAAKAVDREVSYRDGGLYYGFYQLKSRGGKNCYLFYLDQNRNGGNKIILIYLEGRASRDKIKQMLK